MFAISTTGLTKTYGTGIAVQDLDLRVHVSSVYGFLGPNGSGKTTTLRLILGLTQPDSGSVEVLGQKVAAGGKVLGEVGALLQNTGIYDHLSGYDNVDLTRRLLGLRRSENDRVLDIVDLGKAAGKKAGTYSLGMKQRLALARALLGAPRLLLLDEPTNGLDPDGIMMMRTLIRELPERIGGTVLIASHLLSEVEQVASEIGIMFNGKLALQASMASLKQGSSLHIETGNVDQCHAVLSGLGLSVSRGGESILTVDLPTVEPASYDAAKLNAVLVRAGCSVREIKKNANNLEAIYTRVCSATDAGTM